MSTTVWLNFSGISKSSRHCTILRFKPPEYGISSATQSTFAPSSVMRRAMIRPMSPLPRITTRRPGRQPPCRQRRSGSHRREASRRLLTEARLPHLHPALPGSLGHHHGCCCRWSRRGRLRASEGLEQVLHRHGHGGHLTEHRPREAGEERCQAHPHGPHLLDLHRRCQPGDAALTKPVVTSSRTTQVRPRKSARGPVAFQIRPPLAQAYSGTRRGQNKGEDEMRQGLAASA